MFGGLQDQVEVMLFRYKQISKIELDKHSYETQIKELAEKLV